MDDSVNEEGGIRKYHVHSHAKSVVLTVVRVRGHSCLSFAVIGAVGVGDDEESGRHVNKDAASHLGLVQRRLLLLP